MSQDTKWTGEGDDLTAARVFVTSAVPHIRVLTTIERFDRIEARKALKAVSTLSEPLSARAIGRSSATAFDLLEADAPQPQIDSAFMTLQKLMGQYAQGLDEIIELVAQETQSGAALKDESQNTTRAILCEDVSELMSEAECNSSTETPTPIETLATDTPTRAFDPQDIVRVRAEHHMAAQALETLLPRVKDTELTTALHRLMVPAAASFDSQNTQIEFNSIMPSLTHDILTQARQSGKNVSLSYLDADVSLPNAQLETVKETVKALGRVLVQNSLEIPDVRRARGESASGQIFVAITQDDKGYDITLNCSGKSLSPMAKDQCAFVAAPYCVTFDAQDKSVQLALRVPIEKLPQRRAHITLADPDESFVPASGFHTVQPKRQAR